MRNWVDDASPDTHDGNWVEIDPNTGTPEHHDVEDDDDDYTAVNNEIPVIDSTNWPYTFNPPLHPSARHVRPDLASSDPTFAYNQIYQKEVTIGAPAADVLPQFNTQAEGANQHTTLSPQKFRLGRIVMGNNSAEFTRLGLAEKRRYGFRFLYNPATVSYSQNVGADFIPNPESMGAHVIQSGLEQIQVTVVLNRIPDVNGPARAGDYDPPLTTDALEQIRTRGTGYDLDFLYRCCNGVHDTRARSKTGDIGVLLPNPLFLILGQLRSRGAVMSISSVDRLFSKDLVPTYTEVSISFMRYLSMTPQGIERLESSGVRSGDYDFDSDSSGGGGGSDSGWDKYNENTGSDIGHLSKEQSDIARHIVRVGMKSFPSPDNKRAALIGLITGLQESGLENLAGGDRDSVGVFQQRPSAGWGTVAQCRNVALATGAFYGLESVTHTPNDGLKDIDGWQNMAATEAAQAVQRSAYPDAYAKHIPFARTIREQAIEELGLDD